MTRIVHFGDRLPLRLADGPPERTPEHPAAPSLVSSHVLMGFYFFPRGGSAQVTRYLCRAFSAGPLRLTLFAGSIGATTENSNAHRFFTGIRCESLDYSPARTLWAGGGDPMDAPVPMHASYEAKHGVPDRIFFALDDSAFDQQVASWTRFLAADGADGPSRPTVVHLHHLTPIHDAVRRLWPDVPIITHLHGPELKMLASVHDRTDAELSVGWTAEWVDRMRRWASDSARLVVVSAQDEKLVQSLLPVDATEVVTIANGVDTEVFSPKQRTLAERMAKWQHWLVDDPRGWRPGQAEGSISYRPDELSGFVGTDGVAVPIVLFAGRFLRFKRVQLLIEAHHALQSSGGHSSVLVIVGGFPGEWEGEHPFETVGRLGALNVFFAGWRNHDELSDILTCSDVFAAPSVEEPFGLVYLEAMASGLPPIATTTGGPPTFINVDCRHPTGWLVPPDDLTATTQALAEAVSHPAERTTRGRRAATFVRSQYSWALSADAFESLYAEVVDERADLIRGRGSSYGPEPLRPFSDGRSAASRTTG